MPPRIRGLSLPLKWSLSKWLKFNRTLVLKDGLEDFDSRCTLNGHRNVYAVNATDASIIPSVPQAVEKNGLIWAKIDLIVNLGTRSTRNS
jgi:hypothetical protein